MGTRESSPTEALRATPTSATWRLVAASEVLIAAAAVLVDRIVPTLVILVLAALSLAIRRERPSSLGFHRHPHPGRMAAQVLGWTVLWTGVVLGVLMPVLEHLTGEQQDVSQFAEVQGDLAMLVVLLALSWTLAALGEETAYRGFVLTRAGEAVGTGRAGVAGAVLVSSLLFGLAHTEQGGIGVALTFADAVFFSVLRLRYRTVWAPVLAHGFNNTVGLVAFYFVGPVHGLW